MLRIEFEYRDEMSRWEWRRRSCTCRSVEEAKRFYGLGEDGFEWRIVSIHKRYVDTEKIKFSLDLLEWMVTTEPFEINEALEEIERIGELIEDVETCDEKASYEAEAPKLSNFSGERHCLETAKALYELRLIVSGMSAGEADKDRALALLGALIEDVETDAELGGFFSRVDEAEEQILSAAEGRRAR